MIWVVLTVNGAVVKECAVDKELTIGRVPSSDLHINSTEVSSRHAKISPTPTGAVLVDLKSTNGTFLNGETRLEPGVALALEPGMRVCLGPGIIEVRKVDKPAPRPRQTAAAEGMMGTMVISSDDTQQGIVDEARFRAAAPRLVVGLESDRRTINFETTSTEIGREDCAVVIGHPSVSGKHARITYENGFFILRDLQSRNGTFVNGLPVTAPTPLATQTAVTFGTVECLFVQVPPKQGAMDEVPPEVLAGHVVALGKATRHQADMVLQEQKSSGRTIGEIFVEKGILPPREWSEIFAQRKLIGTLAPTAARKGIHPVVWILGTLVVAAIAVWAILR